MTQNRREFWRTVLGGAAAAAVAPAVLLREPPPSWHHVVMGDTGTYVDGVRYWNRALSAEEITALRADPFAGFNEPIGVALEDSRPDGTVTVQLGGRR